MSIEILGLNKELQTASWGSRVADPSDNDAVPRLDLARTIKLAFNKPKLDF